MIKLLYVRTEISTVGEQGRFCTYRIRLPCLTDRLTNKADQLNHVVIQEVHNATSNSVGSPVLCCGRRFLLLRNTYLPIDRLTLTPWFSLSRDDS